VTAERVDVHRGRYADSVALMQLSQQLSAADGVLTAQIAMATELNLEVLSALGFSIAAVGSPNELIIAVRAVDTAAADRAVALAGTLLDRPRPATVGTGAATRPPRTTGSAARWRAESRAGPVGGLALISVPGQHAFTEAVDALEAGLDVLLFSDNVSVTHEVVLKDLAAERNLLVMGPDCGTAVVAGVALGFAHRLDPGPVGIVAASGTGAQQVLCLLDAAGIGISDALGVGGRDLSAQVGARSTRAALARLDRDPHTELILVVSKPAAAEVAAELERFAAGLSTPVEFALLGEEQPDLTSATERVLVRLGRAVPQWPGYPLPAPARADGGREDDGGGPRGVRRLMLRGLFCGGTLCDEAMVLAAASLGEVRSNIPLRPEWALDVASIAGDPGSAHLMIDFGDDTLTRGRAHPMIDPSMRTRYLTDAIGDPRTGVVLLDVVLGYGAHPDPVADLLPVLARTDVPVVVSVIGARRDPQDLDGSIARLRQAGASVFTSNAAAARYAVSLIAEPPGRDERERS